MNIEKSIKSIIKKAVEQSLNLQAVADDFAVGLDVPKNKGFGDFSTNIAMAFAQKTAQPPMELARKIQHQLHQEARRLKLDGQIERIEVKEPGFINFFLKKAFLFESLLEITKQKSAFGRSVLGKGQKVHIEFVSANPTGPLNVAHGRQAAFGDTLANILAFSGYQVTREYYLNDEGVQIDTLGESVRVKYLELLGVKADFPSAGYRGRYVDDLAGELLHKYGRRLLKNSGKKLSLFSQFACRRILAKIKQDLDAFGVHYDSWFSQKSLTKTGKITRVLNILKKKKFLYQKDGAWWLASTKFGDDKDRVVIKSDSRLTYITPDIAYHQTKFKRRFSKMINIWGPDHHGYLPRIRAAVNALGYDAQRISFLIVQLVTLVSADRIIPMSTRLGQFISLADILKAVGKDAARFFFLMRKRDSHLRFDLELAKKQSLDNPVYYIQYAHARTQNILKFAQSAKKHQAKPNLALLDQPEEVSLIQKLREFPAVVESCALNLEPHRITVYLQDLAKDFHYYYEKHRVVTEDLDLSCARLSLVNAVRIVLNNGLDLLSIRAPEKM